MDNILLFFDAPTLLLQIVLDGLLIGAIFALVAYGMALVWGVMNIINITQGEYVILGGYISYLLTSSTGMHPLLTIPIAAVGLFIIGWAIYHLVIHRVVDRDLFISLLATFGISILLQQAMNQMFGSDLVNTNTDLGNVFLFDGEITVSLIKVVGFIAAIILGILLAVFLRRSRIGQAIRATAQDARAARILGVDTNKIYAATYGLNAAICGVAGAIVVMVWVIQPYIGLTYTVRAFMIVIIAGLGNLLGVALSGLGLGALENLAGFILGIEFQSAFVFALLVVILVVRNHLLRRQRRYLK